MPRALPALTSCLTPSRPLHPVSVPQAPVTCLTLPERWFGFFFFFFLSSCSNRLKNNTTPTQAKIGSKPQPAAGRGK